MYQQEDADNDAAREAKAERLERMDTDTDIVAKRRRYVPFDAGAFMRWTEEEDRKFRESQTRLR